MSTTVTDLPTYIKNPNEENYHELFNLIIRTWLSSNGWTLPPTSQANIIAVAPMMPDGTIWYCNDHGGSPVYVGLIGGNLVQFVTNPFP